MMTAGQLGAIIGIGFLAMGIAVLMAYSLYKFSNMSD